MRPALQALLYAPDVALWSDVILGKITATVRTEHRDYRPGPVMLCCHLASACVMAEVTEVIHCRLDEVPELKRRRAGYETAEAMLDGMRRFYPDIGPASAVTIVAFGRLSGTLAKNGMVVMAPENRADDPLVARLMVRS
jgi:hypothetical protein